MNIDEEKQWRKIMEMDFEDLGITQKGRNGIKVDLRIDGFHNYEYSNHLPCLYFRVGEGEYDFLPMIISDKPYIPYLYENTIDDDKLQWVFAWVKRNKDALLKYANEEIGYNTLLTLLVDIVKQEQNPMG